MKLTRLLVLCDILVFFFTLAQTSSKPRVLQFAVSHYEIQIQVGLEGTNETIEQYKVPGNVRIFGESIFNLSSLLFQANMINLTSVSVTLLGVDHPPFFVSVTSIINTATEGQIEIQLEENIEAGIKMEIYMEYFAKMEMFSNNMSTGGLICFAEKNGPKAAAMIPKGFLYPDSDTWRPLFPFMNGKATFNITLIREENYTSVFNGNLLSSVPDTNQVGWMMDQYSQTKRMRPQLISLAVLPRRYSVLESTFKNKTMRIHAQPKFFKLGDPSYALDVGVRLLNFYSSVFNESDEKPEDMNFVLLPSLQPHSHTSLTLLNWGEIIGFEDATGEIAFLPETSWHATMLLKVEDFGEFKWTSEFSYKNSLPVSQIGDLVAGHVVRKILGDSLMSYDLFPGIVQYLKYRGLEYLYTDSHFPASRISHFATEVMLNSIESLDYKEFSEFQIRRMAIKKGFGVLKMLETVLTKQTILNWIKFYKDKTELNGVVVSQADFYELLQQTLNGTEHGNLNVSVIIKSLFNQKGYPIVKAEMVNNGTQILLSQELFRTSRNNSTDLRNLLPEISEIPLFVVSQNEPRLQSVIWLRNESMLIDHNASYWIIFNYEGTGLYRVLYGQELFQGILEQLQRNSSIFSPLTRAQLMSDYIKFKEKSSNYTSYETYLSLTQYLGQETEDTVWNILEQSWWDLKDLFLSLNKYRPIMTYLHQRYDSALAQIGVYKNDSFGLEPPLRNDLRSQLLHGACASGRPSPLCLDLGKNIAEELKADVNNSISLSERGYQYQYLVCAAVASGGDDMFNILNRKYEAISVRNETKKELHQTLGLFTCLQDPTLVKEVVNRIIDENSFLRRQKGDAIYLLGKLVTKLATVEARVPVWDLLRTNILGVMVFNNEWDKSDYFFMPSGCRYSKAELNELISVFTDNEELFGGGARSTLPYLYAAQNKMDAVHSDADEILNFVAMQSVQ